MYKWLHIYYIIQDEFLFWQTNLLQRHGLKENGQICAGKRKKTINDLAVHIIK